MSVTCNNNACEKMQGNPISVDMKDILEQCDCGVFAGSEDVQWSIYIGQQPTQPDSVITIYDQGGDRINTISKCVYENFIFSIRVRGTDYLETVQKAQEVAAGLNLINDYIINNETNFHTTYHVIQQETLPSIERYDDQNRPIFLLDFSGMRELVFD